MNQSLTEKEIRALEWVEKYCDEKRDEGTLAGAIAVVAAGLRRRTTTP